MSLQAEGGDGNQNEEQGRKGDKLQEWEAETRKLRRFQKKIFVIVL